MEPEAVALNNKGVFLGEIGKCEEAIRCFDKAIEVDQLYFRYHDIIKALRFILWVNMKMLSSVTTRLSN